ncbi:MAG: hypothetical protein WEB03_09635 [Nitriliruptor sp.]|uniref:hypothetical protein n=1 Tax=Nitriliruptor sp. TaxID=2448056 RepID=UPI0034A027A4
MKLLLDNLPAVEPDLDAGALVVIEDTRLRIRMSAWQASLEERLEQDAVGGLPVAEIAKLLARLRPG